MHIHVKNHTGKLVHYLINDHEIFDSHYYHAVKTLELNGEINSKTINEAYTAIMNELIELSRAIHIRDMVYKINMAKSYLLERVAYTGNLN